MFAIYGPSGQLFRGPFEELRRVAPTMPGLRIQPVEPAAERIGNGDFGPRPAERQAVVARTALHAYAETQHPPHERQPLTRVSEVMSREPIVLLDSTTVWDAWRHLSQHRVGQAPVVNAQGQLVGLLSWVQLMQADRMPSPDVTVWAWQSQLRQSVAEWMLSPVPSVDPETDLRRLALVLLETGLPGLPVVVDQGRVSGFVSRADILRAVTHDPPLDLWAL